MHSTSLWQQMPPSGRAFVRFWGGTAAAVGVLAITLQIMGPPRLEIGGQDIDLPSADSAQPQAAKIDIPGLQADLLENHSGPNGYALPKRGQHGRMARQVYAAPVVDVPAGSAQVALLIDGVGDSEALTQEAMTSLPGPVSLAISPYVSDADDIIQQARAHKHETLLSLPVQDDKAAGGADAKAANNAGPRALGAGLSASKNMENYSWALSSLAGYAGVTDAFSGQNGGAFPHSPAFTPILTDIDKRGLLYLNATPGTAAQGPGAIGTADVSINTDTDIVNIDIQLLKLQQAARRNGRAIGVMGPLRPVALACLRAWIPHLKDVGITLVPVSMLVAPQPAAAPSSTTPAPSTGPAQADGGMHVHLSAPNWNQQNSQQPRF